MSLVMTISENGRLTLCPLEENNWSISIYEEDVIKNHPDWPRLVMTFKDGEHSSVSTSRDFDQYKDHVAWGRRDHRAWYQYNEVGAGLGGFLPEVVAHFGDSLKHLPVVIDPFNYMEALPLLDSLSRLPFDSYSTAVLTEARERCFFYLNPEKVRLINTTLQAALTQFPEIHHSAHVVVDHKGPGSHKEFGAEITSLERRLYVQPIPE